MQAYAKRLAAVEGELARVWARQDAGVACDEGAITAAVLDGSNEEAFAAVWDAARAGASAERIARALVVAGAERVLRFDDAHERDPSIAEAWLWATHRFTFASAVRNAVLRFRSPEALRLLVHAVMFIHSGRRMDLAPEARFQVDGESASIEGVVAAIDARDPLAAVRRGLGFLAARGARFRSPRRCVFSLRPSWSAASRLP
ncbi:MAG: hypothetical protein GY711_14020 [bacterium]|nr:hypothetical protein [bacterium]